MNKIRETFSISDLENLSSIKAHTIRIWEKRYHLFTPNRDANNIRYYTNEDLQHLLNISFLSNYGYKISIIAKLSKNEIEDLILSLSSKEATKEVVLNQFKIAMLNFNAYDFHKSYASLQIKISDEEIFYEVIFPFLNQIGLLWQTNSIKPAHEHFVSYLIINKLISLTENLPSIRSNNTNIVYVLFLPDGEIHELGLLFINYVLRSKGLQTVYLGSSIPHENLIDVKNKFNTICYISSFTVMPNKDNIDKYLECFFNDLLKDTNDRLLITGQKVSGYSSNKSQIRIFENIKQMLMFS